MLIPFIGLTQTAAQKKGFWSKTDSNISIKGVLSANAGTFTTSVTTGKVVADSARFSGTVIVGGIIKTKVGAFGYLTASDTTIISTSGTYYPIGGVFTTSPSYMFTPVADPGIRYDGDLAQYFLIQWNASFSVNVPGTTVTLGVKDGGLLSPSLMSQYCKNAAELYSVSGVIVVGLSKNDVIQLIITSEVMVI